MRQKLTRAGYRAVSQVTEHGEFAVRGSLLDLFPMGADTPMRVDLFDDEVESIRMFDPESQRSSEKVDGVDLLPAREVPIDAEGIANFAGRGAHVLKATQPIRWSTQGSAMATRHPELSTTCHYFSTARVRFSTTCPTMCSRLRWMVWRTPRSGFGRRLTGTNLAATTLTASFDLPNSISKRMKFSVC